MKWIELTLRHGHKVLQNVDQIGDIYVTDSGYTRVSPIYMKGEDYQVKESLEEIKQLLVKCGQVFVDDPVAVAPAEEELGMLKKWMEEHGYEFNS